MLSPIFLTIAITGFSVAFLHAALPTHWLPFVMTARAQGWNRSKTMGVTLMAGTGHVAFTSVLGLLLVWLGIELDERLGQVFHWAAGAILITLGIFYLSKKLRGRSHCHAHHHEILDSVAGTSQLISDRAAISGLVVLLTLSPCEVFLPVYLSGIQFGWSGFFILSAVLAIATLGGMLLFTWLTLVGLEKLELEIIEKYENEILGAALVGLGILVLTLEH